MARPLPIAVSLLAGVLAASGCDVPAATLRLEPAVIRPSECTSAELTLLGLPPSAYLATTPSGLSLRGEPTFEIGGVSAHLVRVDGAPIITLDRQLALGRHDLEVVAGGRTYFAADALEVRDEPVDAGRPTDATLPNDVTPSRHCARSDLVACWPFDGDGLDHGRRGNHLTLTDVGFPDGRAAVFGASSGATLPTTADLSASMVSIMAWVRVDEAPGGLRYAMLVERAGSFFLAVAGSGRLWCGVDASFFDYVRSPGEISVGEWHHVACVRDADNTSLYVDGEKVDTRDLGAFTAGDGALSVGESAPDGDHQLVGALDELRIYDAVLSPGEVQSDYLRGRP